MADAARFEIGQGFTIAVRDYEELREWMNREQEKWRWLVPNDGRTDRHGYANNVQTTWQRMAADLGTLTAQGRPIEEAQAVLRPLSGGPLIASETPDGIVVLDILKSAGDEAASFAAGILRRSFGPNAAQTPEEFRGLLLAMAPDLTKPVEWAEKLKRERANFRQSSRDLAAIVENEAAGRRVAALEQGRRITAAAHRIFKNRMGKWREDQSEWRAAADAAVEQVEANANSAVERIDITNETYTALMQLKAPVEYWNKKKGFHAEREASARWWLYIYFPVSISTLAVAFFLAGGFLLNHPDTASSHAPVALYVVVSGGLLLLSTIAFWIGRLLTKLYLSEHHLRNDAEERATMTETYLALYNDSSASDVDRQLILAALFRATPDGIVKDDGPSDVGLQGMIAKAITNLR
jgi:hypothetical protein